MISTAGTTQADIIAIVAVLVAIGVAIRDRDTFVFWVFVWVACGAIIYGNALS